MIIVQNEDYQAPAENVDSLYSQISKINILEVDRNLIEYVD